MSQSLSIIFPVRNSQQTLRPQITDLLEVLPDLTNHFEVVVVDDASTDGTEEVARELAREFPQLRVLRQRVPCGAKGCITMGIEQSMGEVILVKEDAKPLRMSDLRQLWSQREQRELGMVQADPEPLNPHLIRRLFDWGAALEKHASKRQGGLQMIRRRTVEQYQPVTADV